MLTLPKEATRQNYKLLPALQYHTSRNKPVLGMVLHITAGLQDYGLSGSDESMEGTVKWALSAKPEASWHAGADSDGVELCLPDWYTAWHVVGYNSCTVGLEISKANVVWKNAPKAWVEDTLRNAARYCAAIVKKYNLPVKLSTKAEVDRAIARGEKFGFSYHMWLNPNNRSDPGKDFPWEQLKSYILAELHPVAPKPITMESEMYLVQLEGQDPVFKSDGFQRQHIGQKQLVGLLRAGLKVIKVKSVDELNAYGPEVPNPVGTK